MFRLSIALSAGIVVQHYARLEARSVIFTLFFLVLSAWVVSFILLTSRRLLASTVSLLVGFFTAGLLLGWVGERTPAPDRISRMYDEGTISADHPVDLVGVIKGEPEPAPGSFYLKLRLQRVIVQSTERKASGTIMLLARIPTEKVRGEFEKLDLHHGARIRVMTRLDREDDFRNPGVSPFTEYLERKGFDATGTIKSPLLVERLDDDSVFLPLTWVYAWRAKLQKEFATNFSSETAGVLDAALLGNPYNISSGAAERLRDGGTFHILVISGLQIAFIAGVALLVVRRITGNKLIQFLLAAAFLWAYAIAVGAEASVARAALMFTIVVFAPVVARRANSINSVAGAGLLLLVVNPRDLFDPSFQLTFLSVFAIVCVALPLLDAMRRVGTWRPAMVTPYPPRCPPWFRRLAEALFWSEREWRQEVAASNIQYRLFKTRAAATLERLKIQKLLRYALSAFVISGSVQLVLLPLMVVYFHRVSLASLLLNIFVGGLMAVLGITALIAVAISQISPILAAPLIMTAEKTSWLMIHVVDPFSSLGLASLRLPHYRGWAASVYVLYFLLLTCLVAALGKWNPLSPPFVPIRARSRRLLQVASASLVITLLLVLTHPLSAARPDGKLHVEFLDVGQGDCALLTMPDGTTILVDGGGRPSMSWTSRGDGDDAGFERETRSIGDRVVSEYLWARGLDRVNYVIATHADADHIDGLNDVVRNFAVRAAIVARAPANDAEFAKFTQTLKNAGVSLEIVGRGDSIRAGNVMIDILWPGAAVTGRSRNNDSLVVRLRFGDRSFLFGADIEKETESSLVAAGFDLRSDVVKVPHHGSRTSSTGQFVKATRPALAVISVGRYSMFGHPHPEVVERWQASGAQVMTTGEKGTISVVTDGHRIAVTTYFK